MKVNNSVAFHSSHLYNSRTFLSPQKKTSSTLTLFLVPPPLSPWQPLIYLSLWIGPFGTFHVHGIIQYVAFVSGSSRSRMFPRFFHVVAYIGTSFLFVAERYSVIPLCHSLFIRSSVGHLGCFCLLAIVSNAAMNLHVWVFI